MQTINFELAGFQPEGFVQVQGDTVTTTAPEQEVSIGTAAHVEKQADGTIRTETAFTDGSTEVCVQATVGAEERCHTTLAETGSNSAPLAAVALGGMVLGAGLLRIQKFRLSR